MPVEGRRPTFGMLSDESEEAVIGDEPGNTR
jgi:hypothetical protein